MEPIEEPDDPLLESNELVVEKPDELLPAPLEEPKETLWLGRTTGTPSTT